MLKDMSIESISRIKELDKNKSNLARFKFDKTFLIKWFFSYRRFKI